MLNFAHRGASKYFPENTILAFKEAIKANANGIELDVHKTKDNILVVIHDEDIQRTFKGKGLVKDMTLKELRSFKCRNINFEENLECRLPTLEDVLELIKDTNIILNIEIKTDKIHYEGIEKDVIDMINKYKLKERVIISSFNHGSIKICREIDDKIEIGLLYEKPIEDVVKYAKVLGVDAIHPDLRLVSEKLIIEAKENNIKVNVYTVNYPEYMKILIKAGVNGIITDYPDLLQEVICSV